MENNMPLLGDKFPELTVTTTQGEITLPKHFEGKWFVLFSHPSDFTPVCTTEFVSFQEHKKDFHKLGCELIGLSIDQVFSHIKWIEWIKDNMKTDISFPIIAGTDSVAMKLGMLHPDKGSTTVRAVFIVDPKGAVRLVMYYPQEVGRNMAEILRSVKALQVSDSNNVAIPANWPESKLFGDDVIVEPAKTIADAKKRLEDKNITCLDWWLCHKKL